MGKPRYKSLIEIEDLSTLDLCAWTGSQQETARLLHASQSTICRRLQRSNKLLTSIGVRPKGGKTYTFHDEHQILREQRRLHQKIRLIQGKDLRIQATCWTKHLLLEPTPEGWIPNQASINNFKHRPTLDLLNESVIDAALTTNPEAPPESDRRYARHHLSDQPLFLLTPKSNTLSKEKALSATDVTTHTELGHSGFVSNECREAMERLDQKLFGEQDHKHLCSYEEPQGSTRRYGTAMTMLIRPDLTRLDHEMNFSAGDILVVKQELAEHAEIIKLVAELKKRLQQYQHTIDGLEIRR